MLRLTDSQSLTGTILLNPFLQAARAVALFNASAAENRIKGLPGFAGSIIFAGIEANRVLELVRWDAASSLEAVREDYRFADHLAIVKEHTTLEHMAFLPISSSSGKPHSNVAI